MQRLISLLCAAALTLILCGAAFAVDGVTLINQATAVNGLSGCPNDGISLITICQPGSYRLSGNLLVTGIKNGVDIATSRVTLDLNGFSISGPSLGSGVAGASSGINVLNGSISDMGYGVQLPGAGDSVTNVTVMNSTNGIVLNLARVTNCRVLNSGIGIELTGGGLASGNTLSGNYYGILLYKDGSASGNYISGSNVGITFSAHGFYSGNVLSGNTTDVSGGVSHSDNICSGGGAC